MEFHTFHLVHWPKEWSQQDVYKYEMELIQYAEDVGFDGVWLAEHHFRNYGICPSIMPFAAFVAARTRRVKIGSAIVVLPFHHPLRAAEEAAEVDLLSGGRLMYGFGRGYQSIEFQGFNIPLSEARERTDEIVDIMKLAWADAPVTYRGKHYTIENVNVYPKPLQKPHPPMWSAAVSPETIRHQAERGMPFITDPIATFGRCQRAADEWRSIAGPKGFDTSNVAFGCQRGLIIGETEQEARAMALRAHEMGKDENIVNLQSAPIEKTGEFAAGYYYWKDRYLGKNQELTVDFFWDRVWIAGDPRRCIERLETLEAMGFKHVIFTLGHYPTVTLEMNKRRLKIFSESVIPHFKRKAQAQPGPKTA